MSTQKQVVYVERKQSGCLMTAVVYLLFGWIGLAVMAAWKLTKLAWKLLVAYPWQWTIALTKWSIKTGQWFHAKYGWRGWAVLSVVVVALAIIGKITGN